MIDVLKNELIYLTSLVTVPGALCILLPTS